MHLFLSKWYASPKKPTEKPTVPDLTLLWPSIQKALDELFQPLELVDGDDLEHVSSASPKTYMEAYAAVLKWMTSSDRSHGVPGAALYKRVDNYLETVCKTLSSRLSSNADSASSLQRYSATYNFYEKQLNIAARLLAYVEKHYVNPKVVDEGRGWSRQDGDYRVPDHAWTYPEDYRLVASPGTLVVGARTIAIWTTAFWGEDPAAKKETPQDANHAELIKYRGSWTFSPDTPFAGNEFVPADLRAEAETSAGVTVSIVGTGLRQWRLQVITTLQNAQPGFLSRLADAEDDVFKAQVLRSLQCMEEEQDVLNTRLQLLEADETESLFPLLPDPVHSALEEGISLEVMHNLTTEIKEHKENGNADFIRAAIDVLDDAILLTDPMDNIYRHAIEYLRYWCRISGELPASCKFPDFVDFDIRLGHPHSSTSSSDVYKGEYLGVPVAVKIPRFHADNQSRAHRAFRNEVVTWKCLRHPNIVPFMGISSISPVCLVSEWMPEGTLLAFLKRNPEEHRIKYINDILQGLDFMHRLGVIHGDLKAANVLVDEGRMARLTDFGLATVLHNSTIAATTLSRNGVGGTVRWQAPELYDCFDREGEDVVRPSIPTDIYALAVTLWELFTLLTPFPHVRTDNGVLIRVLRGERPTKPTDCEDVGFSDTLWDVMQRGWDAKAELRPPLADFAAALGGTLEAPVLA